MRTSDAATKGCEEAAPHKRQAREIASPAHAGVRHTKEE